MCYACYKYDDDRPNEEDEENERSYEIWLSDQEAIREYVESREYAEEHATVIDSTAAPKAAHADPDTW